MKIYLLYDYNGGDWWIDRDIIFDKRESEIEASRKNECSDGDEKWEVIEFVENEVKISNK